MGKRVVKAILPVAGLGTRLLPATKSIPKEIVTLVDRPLIQYAIDEGRAAGIEQFILVTSRGKNSLEDYFDRSPHLENTLLEQGKTDRLDDLSVATSASGEIVYVRQYEQLGLGHAVWCARKLIANEPFAVMLTDDIIVGRSPCLGALMDVHDSTGGNVVALMETTPESVPSYGIVEPAAIDGRLVTIAGMVEKPEPGSAPSNLAVVGRYILTPRVLDHLDRMQLDSDQDSEIQLTDAIAAETATENGVFGYLFEGERHDCGSKAGYLNATVAIALGRSDLRDAFLETLTDTVERARSDGRPTRTPDASPGGTEPRNARLSDPIGGSVNSAQHG